mmetsp:Transcript_1845/g.4857  ORF Transcript_1845/g.4857 Transcript_1845/m.4857 type:complete len:417 (-) Transcript_1845:1638-2888(-)
MGSIELPQRTGDASNIADNDDDDDDDDDWHDEEIAPTETNSDGGELCYSDDGSDDTEGIALLQTSLDLANETAGVVPDHPEERRENHCTGRRLWNFHWLGPDTEWRAFGSVLLDEPAVKLVKFAAATALCMVLVHSYAEQVGDKRDETLGLFQLLVYDGSQITTDVLAFFVVGRLHEQDAPGVDTIEFVLPLLLVAVVQSWAATHLASLQHSITPKELKCDWTWPMYAVVFGGCLPLLGGLVLAHAREALKRGTGLRKLVEVGLCLGVVLAPYGVSNDDYNNDDYNDDNDALRSFVHWHHWYWAWVLGMHCNFHARWWSRLPMSFLWGVYVNGVAIFGRDPVLGCAVSLYRSQSQECFPYLKENYGYGNYTLGDLGTDLGILALPAAAATATAADAVSESGEYDVCASDVTRWLLG